MNLYIDYKSYGYDDDMDIRVDDDPADLIDCCNCVEYNNPDCNGVDDDDKSRYKLGTTLCRSWRPVYELIY